MMMFFFARSNDQIVLHVYHHPNSLLHQMGGEHLEAPERVRVIEKALLDAPFPTKFIEARKATDKEILANHSEELFNRLYRSSGLPRMKLTHDTFTNMYTFDAAITAAGGAIQVAENIKSNHGFAMLRPPGHHATKHAAMGFCFFNNVAIAARAIMKKNRRIVILDVDQHFGNGTYHSFKDNHDVLYMSLHSDPEEAYPGTGFAESVGEDEGLGRSVNIPLPWKTGDADYLVAFDEVAIPIIEQFKPDVLLVSLGLDALREDPYGSLGLSVDGYYEIGRRLGELNSRLTNNKIGTILEGGYNYSLIGDATVEFFRGILQPEGERVKPHLSPRISFVLRKIKAIQRNYWIGL